MRQDLDEFKNDVKKVLKDDLAEFKGEVLQELQSQNANIAAAQTRIADIESAYLEMKETLLAVVKENTEMREKVFLEFHVKELVLRSAWQKKIEIDGKRLYFDNDYATDVMEKRKAYGPIKAALREKEIRYQTPYTKMQVHWDW